MRLRAVLNDRKYTRTFALLALLLFAGAFFLHHMASQKEEEARALSAEADRIRQFAAGPRRPSSLPFLENLFRSTDADSLAAAMEEGGLKVDGVWEEQKEGDRGDFHIFHISGTGTYAQIVQTFDIIKGKERWNAVNLKKLKRSPNGLAYEVEIRTFQIRGTYEKEKYSPHRSHGHWQEPGGENTL